MSLTKITNKSLSQSTILNSNIADNTITGSKLALNTVTRDRLAPDAADSNPIGTVIYFAGSTPPVGYLVADGAILPRSVYPELFSVIGTTYDSGFFVPATHFRIPDLRAEFIRGWDNGRGIDPNRIFGSFQEEMINQHKHWISSGSYDDGNMSTTGTANTQEAGLANDSGVYSQDDPNKIYGRFCRMDPGHGENYETRPRNVALLPCIKFGNGQAFGQTAIDIQALAASKLNLTGGTITGELKIATSRTVRRIVALADTNSYTAGSATWVIGPRFSTISGFKAGSLIRLFYHVPGRNDAGGWGGGYTEPQISYDGGNSYVSLGSSGYDGGVMHYGGASNGNSLDIGNFNNLILIDPQQTNDFSVTVRIYIKSYDGTYVVNRDSNLDARSGTAPLAPGVNGLQHWAHIIVEELY